jgi:ElaB/YqjD/DUF883 family membrane-anchored ribosome-binding protein
MGGEPVGNAGARGVSGRCGGGANVTERNSMKANTQIERVVDDLKVLGHDADELVRATAGDARETVCEARARLGRAIEAARRSCDRAQRRVKEGVKMADEAVHKHPYETVGVAFGAGLVLGALAAGRRR